MKLILASLIAATALGLAANYGDPTLDAYTAKLQAAKSLSVEYKLAVDGAQSNCTLSYSSPNRLRIETPTKLEVSDGTNLWILNKTDNTYTETQANTMPAQSDDVYAWRGFFVKAPFSDATDVASGDSISVGGVQVQKYTFMLSKGRKATLLLDASGVARGAIVEGDGKRVTALASKVVLAETPLPDSTFTFTAPDGAKKIEASVASAASFAAAEAVLKQYCTGCHGADSKRAGLDLSSYAAVMAGRRGMSIVTAGDAANSRLITVMSGSTKKMPPGDDAVPDAGVKAVSDWIQAGAKNDN